MRNPNSKCKVCTSLFYCPPSRKLKGYGQFCSKVCMGLSKKGTRDKNLTHVAPRKTFSTLTYSGKHSRIRRDWGQNLNCENCQTKTSKKYEWANLSGEYKEDRSDWVRLCTSCHVLLDKGKLVLLCE